MASKTNDSWFYLAGERPVGPVTAEQLRAAVSAGTIRAETSVRNGAWLHWCQAGQVPGLIPAPPTPPPGPSSAATPPPVFATPPPRNGNGAAAGPPTPPPVFATPPPLSRSGGTPAGPTAGPPSMAGPPPVFATPPGPPTPPAVSPNMAAPPGSATPPAVAAATAAAGFAVQVAGPNRAAGQGRDKKKKKKQSPLALLLFSLAAVAACILLAVGVWIAQTREHEPPAKRAVAQAEPKPETTDEPSDSDQAFNTAFRKPDPQPVSTNFPMPAMTEPVVNTAMFEESTPPTPQGKLDELVFAKWKQLGIEPAHRCSDAAFLRRVYLDVIGTLPTPAEARQFLTDKSPDKRAKLIDALLERPEFVDYWAMKWSDLLRVKAEFPINLWPNAAQAYHRWLRHAIRDNMPYDRFVRALLTSSGSNFRVPQVNFYRALQSKDPRGIAQAVALTFMGTRADKWPTERLEGMTAFFRKIGYKPTGEWKEEIVIFDPHKGEKVAAAAATTGTKKPGEKPPADKKGKPLAAPAPVFPDGTEVEIAWDKDPREVFADWLITPENPWFTRQIVNRVWYWLQGRGIVHEPDDIRADNPPSNPELLDWLAAELIQSHYDLKHIYRLILNSSTYQLSAIPRSKDPQAAAQFASYTVRRLEAEVIIDALNQITGTTESYSSIIPEPYTFVPENCRAIALPDGSITSSFLELFGRPPRDSGLESERNNRITAAQRLHLLNSSHIRNKLRNGPGIKNLLTEGNSRENLYLAILSRFPADGEGGGGEALAWTLINTTEFLFRH